MWRAQLRRAIQLARILLGLIFLVFGVNGFFRFIPVPTFHPFVAILVASGYIYLIKTIEVAGGLLLLVNRFVPLALLLLGPDIVNILAYHLLLDPRNWPIAVINLGLFGIVLWGYWPYFKPLLVRKADVR